MGFAAGFAAGWGAVDSAMRQKMDAERAKKDDEYRTAQQAMQTERFGREQKAWKEQDAEDAMKRDATQPVPVGTSVGENFTANPGTAAWLAQQSADQAELSGDAPARQSPAIGLAIGKDGLPEVKKYGNQTDASKAGAFENSPIKVQGRLVKGYQALGKPDKMFAAQEMLKRMKDEGAIEGLDMVLKNKPKEEILAHLNSRGNVMVKDIEITPTETDLGARYGKQPSAKVVLITEDGRRIETPDALRQRMEYGTIEQRLERAAGNQAAERALKSDDRQDRKLDLEAEKVKINQQIADARERNDAVREKYLMGMLAANQARTEALIARASGGSGGSGKAGDAPGAPGVDRNDEKHIAEIVGNMGLPKGTNPALIVDTAARIKALAPGISASEAATIAATPGAKVRSVQTNKGVFDALEVPDREVVGKDGKKSIMPGGVYLMTPGARQIPVPRPPPAPAAPKLSAAQIAAMDAEKRAADEQAAQVAQQEAAAARAAATAAFARPR